LDRVEHSQNRATKHGDRNKFRSTLCRKRAPRTTRQTRTGVNVSENRYNPLSRASRRAEALGYGMRSPPARARADYFFKNHKPSALQDKARLRGTRTPMITLSPIGYRLSAIDYRLSIIGYRLSAIDYRLSIIGYRLSAIDYRLSIIGYRLSAIDYRLSIIGYRLSAMQGAAPPAYRSKRNPSSRSTSGKSAW
jgi:hypothetical protein